MKFLNHSYLRTSYTYTVKCDHFHPSTFPDPQQVQISIIVHFIPKYMYIFHFIFYIIYIILYKKNHKVQLVLWSCACMWSIHIIVGNLAVRTCPFKWLSIAPPWTCLMYVYNDSFCEFMSVSAMSYADCTVTFSIFSCAASSHAGGNITGRCFLIYSLPGWRNFSLHGVPLQEYP